MTKEEIHTILDNSYKYSSEGFLIDKDIVADKIVALYKEQTTSLKAEVERLKKQVIILTDDYDKNTDARIALNESLQSQLSEKEKEVNFAKASINHLKNVNTTLHNRLAKAEADKQEILEFIKGYSRDNWNDVLQRIKRINLIDKHGNNK